MFLPVNSITAQIIPDFLVNEQGSIDGSQQAEPNMAGDGNGSYVVTWEDKRNGSDFDIFAQMCQSDGTPLGENFRVNDDVGTRRQYEPAVGVNSNLDFVIAWIDRRNGNINTDWDIYAQRYDSNGNPLGENFIVNDQQNTSEKSHPSVSIDSIGNFVIVWTDKQGNPSDIYGQRFSNDGAALGDNFKINDDVGNYWQLRPTSACDKSGNLIVSWVDKRNNSNRQIYAQRYSPEGIALGENFQVNTDLSGANHFSPDIAIDGNSNFIIVWDDYRNGYPDIYAQRYLNDGSALGDNFKINEDTPNTSQNNPSVSADFEGNFSVCWEDNRNDYNDVFARQFSEDGIPLSGDFKVSSDITFNAKQENSVIGSDEEGNFIICWQDHRFGYNGEIFAQSYLSDGTAVEDNFMVNDDLGSENQQYPSIALDENENFIIAWADNRLVGNGIYAQQFSSDGTVLGNNFKVNDDTGDNWTLHPSVAANSDGSFIISWSDFRNGNHDIYAQRFSSEGVALGSNFKVNYLSAFINYSSTVACKPNGDFIICWGDLPEDSKDNGQNITTKKLMGEPDIWCQQYMSDGTPLGENFKVNDDGGWEAQMNPDMAIDANGNFVIAWEDKRNDIYEIFLQRYLSDGTPIGANFTVEDTVYSEWQLSPSVACDSDGNFIVTWRDNRNGDYDIFSKRFFNDGTPMENSFQVNSDNGIHYKSLPCISLQDDGRFIISWADDRNGTYDVYAQRFWSDGLPYSDNFQVASMDIMDQSGQDVVLINNRIYNAWHDNKSGQTGYDVWANVLDWDTGVGLLEKPGLVVSSDLCLYQNNPNPFGTSTTISYIINKPGLVHLKLYDLQGRKVKSLIEEHQQKGTYSIVMDGRELNRGIYLMQLELDVEISEVKKMVKK